MSLEDFQLLDNETIDNSIIKTDFLKVYHQKGAQLNQSDQNIEFIFGENNNFHKIGDAYLEFDILQYGKMILQIIITTILFV